MAFSQYFRYFAASVGWPPNVEPDDDAFGLTPDDVEELMAQSPGEEYSTATPFYDVYSNGPNLYNLPVEMFGMIIEPLSRQDVKHLRLVCRQCEAKVSAHFFKELVIPFQSQFYNSSAPDSAEALKNISSTMLSNGGRVFDEFGHIVRRFALSLELDEEALEYPPPKPKQELIRAFWGLYRWPHALYSRYQDVSGMENDADELGQMKKALRRLSDVTALGLCSDIGLGFLSGPNVRARDMAIRCRVFLDPDWRQYKKKLKTTPLPVVFVGEALSASGRRPSAVVRVPQNWKAEVLIAMLQNAGFEEEQMQAALALLLESECGGALSDMNFDESHAPEIPTETTQGEYWDLLPPFQPLRRLLPASAIKEAPNPTDYPLVPSALTRAQLEMLLELEWVHRAMAQSYILSTIDCSGEGCFRYLTTFNIAKIPSSHLHILSRHDFWKSFPSLRNVSLGVVADWRRVYVSAPECIDEESVSPLDAVPLAHALIRDYISVEAKIESIHFEWICGGELASGCHQRNQHVLPAPLFASPANMARPAMAKVGTDGDLLRLPYVKHLSLKNCWVAPHVLLQFFRDCALCSLERVEFESVSLSVMPSTAERPLPMSLINLGPGPQGIRVPPISVWDRRLPLEQPSWMSWAGLIEHFSPSAKVRDVLGSGEDAAKNREVAAERQRLLGLLKRIIPDAAELSNEGTYYTLESLTFKSCGYVALDPVIFHIGSMIPVTELQLLLGTLPMVSEFTPLMQRCTETLMGRIVNFGMLNDKTPLRDVFKMSIGWRGVYDTKIMQAARADGCRRFGVGRFSGTVAKEIDPEADTDGRIRTAS